MKIGGSLRAVWIKISALGLRCESQGGPGLVVFHYNGYELPSEDSWAGLSSPWAFSVKDTHRHIDDIDKSQPLGRQFKNYE